MLTRKDVATVAIVAMVLALGTAGILTAIGQESYATVRENIKPPCNDHNFNNDAACLPHGPPFKGGIGN